MSSSMPAAASASPGSASALLRGVGLLPDGPFRWGQPLTSRSPGLYLVELPEPLATPPIELARVGKWLERVPDLRLDGERPTSKALLGRLVALWLPSTPTLFAGATGGNLGARVHALTRHAIGDRRPHPDGHWLHLLSTLERCRIWVAETDAPEEYLDAVLEGFAQAVNPALPPTRPAEALPLPWASLRHPAGDRQWTGISGSTLPDPDPPQVVPSGPVVVVADGDAEGARAPEPGSGTTRRAPRSPARPATPAGPPKAAERGRVGSTATSGKRAPEPVALTASAMARLDAELDELVRVRRPEVVARIKAARELGDLRENAEYQAAREEQSFLEGRIQLLEERRRNAVLIDAGRDPGRAGLGSTIVVERDGEVETLTLVGSPEADPDAGRISVASPVGAGLAGATAGREVEIRTPRGTVRYRVLEVR